MAERVELLRDSVDRQIESNLRAWRERGWIPEMDLRVAAGLHFGLVESAVRDCFLLGGGADPERWVAETTRCLAAILGQCPVEQGPAAESPRTPAP